MAEASATYPLLTPQPGWTEQNPSDWVETAHRALKELAQKPHHGNWEPVSIRLSGQIRGATFLDKQGQVVRPALLCNNQHTALACAEIEAAVSRRELIQHTGNPAATGFQLPKLVWLRQAEPEHHARTSHQEPTPDPEGRIHQFCYVNVGSYLAAWPRHYATPKEMLNSRGWHLN